MKTILISGSSSGIGRAIAGKQLALNDYVVGLARDHAKYQPNSKNYFPHKIDFAKIATLERETKTIQQAHPLIDTIVCAAGYGVFQELEQFSISGMQDLLNVNFLSQAILIKTFLSSLKRKKQGKIIFIGSECALDGQKKGSLYCASKFALRGFAQSLRKECVSANIQVTLINPGFVDTPFFDKLHFKPAEGEQYRIKPSQIADLVSLILSDEQNCVYDEINLQPMKKVIT